MLILTKVIHIVTIIKTSVLIIIIGSYEHSPKNTYASQPTNYKRTTPNHNSQNKNISSHRTYNINKSTKNSNCQNNNIYNNFTSSNTTNSTNSTSFDNLSILNDVYGEKTSAKTSNDSSFENTTKEQNKNIDFSSILSSFMQSNNDSNSVFNDANMPDLETLLKFKKIFERLNSKTNANSPIINLLYAIKPFIQDSKKSIIDQLTKFISISSALQDFNSFL